MSGQLDGRPVGGALLDVWQAQTNGLGDPQDPNLHEMHMCGKFHTDAEGRYLVRTVLPVHYPIPSEGSVGALLRAAGRQPCRGAYPVSRAAAAAGGSRPSPASTRSGASRRRGAAPPGTRRPDEYFARAA